MTAAGRKRLAALRGKEEGELHRQDDAIFGLDPPNVRGEETRVRTRGPPEKDPCHNGAESHIAPGPISGSALIVFPRLDSHPRLEGTAGSSKEGRRPRGGVQNDTRVVRVSSTPLSRGGARAVGAARRRRAGCRRRPQPDSDDEA